MKRIFVWASISVLAIVALVAALVLRAAGHSHYRVTVVNRGQSAILNGTVGTSHILRNVPKLEPGKATDLEFVDVGEDDYRVHFAWASGKQLVDTVGYVTSGIAMHDTMHVFEDSIAWTVDTTWTDKP